MNIVNTVQTFQARRRALKEAQLMLREARRVVRRNRHKLDEKPRGDLERAIDELDAAQSDPDFDRLKNALARLDKLLDRHLAEARKSTAREYGESIFVAVLIALFLRCFVVEAFKIPSGSMIPTLQVGDHIFVNKFIYGIHIPFTGPAGAMGFPEIRMGAGYRKPQRGEVIVFVYPENPSQDFIKRIVAVEGDSVEIKDDAVYINDQPVERKHVSGPCSYQDKPEERIDAWEDRQCDAFVEKVKNNKYTTIYDARPHTGHSWAKRLVPPNSVFVMGDNRDNSHDSRFWGFVPFENIKGKAMVIWWSGDGFSHIRWERMFQLVR